MAVTASSAKFTNAMVPNQRYLFTASIDCWVTTALTGGAAIPNTADNVLYVRGMALELGSPDDTGTTNAFVHVIRDTASGDATLALVEGSGW